MGPENGRFTIDNCLQERSFEYLSCLSLVAGIYPVPATYGLRALLVRWSSYHPGKAYQLG